MAIVKAISSGASLKRAIDYVLSHSVLHDSGYLDLSEPKEILKEFELTKEMYRKQDGTQYKHYVVSFPAEEKVSPEFALKFAEETFNPCKEMKGFDKLFAVHTDTEHTHIHVIVNSVSYRTGNKIKLPKSTLKELKERCNQLAKDNNLSIPEKTTRATTWNKKEYDLLESNPKQSWKYQIAISVLESMKVACSLPEFNSLLSEQGISLKSTGKYLVFEDMEGNKVRDKNLSETYKIEINKEKLDDRFDRNFADRTLAELEGTTDPTIEKIKARQRNIGKEREHNTGASPSVSQADNGNAPEGNTNLSKSRETNSKLSKDSRTSGATSGRVGRR